jgi:hypothetical protein
LIRYEVTVEASSKSQIPRFLEWMQEEHGPDMLSVNGCQECRVFRIDEKTVRCEYLFESDSSLQNYLDAGANAMRQKFLTRFSPEDLSFTRTNVPLLFSLQR